MKYIITYEKYQHTPQDKVDDMYFIREFSEKFEDLFEFRLNLEQLNYPEFRNYLGYGADVHYVGNIELNNEKILKRKVNITYDIFLSSEINPNGITGENDIGRTFTIKFEIMENKSRNVNKIRNFYGYSREMDDVLEKFDNYLSDVLGIWYVDKELEKTWKKKKEFDKKIKQFNL